MKNIINITLAIVMVITFTACGGGSSSGGSDKQETAFAVVGHEFRYCNLGCYNHYLDLGYDEQMAFYMCDWDVVPGDVLEVGYAHRFAAEIINEDENTESMTVVVRDANGDVVFNTTLFYTITEDLRNHKLGLDITYLDIERGSIYEVEVWATSATGRNTSSYVFDVAIDN